MGDNQPIYMIVILELCGGKTINPYEAHVHVVDSFCYCRVAVPAVLGSALISSK